MNNSQTIEEPDSSKTNPTTSCYFNFVSSGYSTRSSSTKLSNKSKSNFSSENRHFGNESTSTKSLFNKSFIEEDNQFSTQDDATYDLINQDNQLKEDIKEANTKVVITNHSKTSNENSKKKSEITGTNISYTNLIFQQS